MLPRVFAVTAITSASAALVVVLIVLVCVRTSLRPTSSHISAHSILSIDEEAGGRIIAVDSAGGVFGCDVHSSELTRVSSIQANGEMNLKFKSALSVETASGCLVVAIADGDGSLMRWDRSLSQWRPIDDSPLRVWWLGLGRTNGKSCIGAVHKTGVVMAAYDEDVRLPIDTGGDWVIVCDKVYVRIPIVGGLQVRWRSDDTLIAEEGFADRFGFINCVAMSGDGKNICIGTSRGDVVVYNIAACKVSWSQRVTRLRPVVNIQSDYDGGRVAFEELKFDDFEATHIGVCASGSGTGQIGQVSLVDCGNETIRTMVFARNGDRLFLGSDSGCVLVVQLK